MASNLIKQIEDAEDVVEPEGVAEVGAPIEELLSTPSIITGELFVEAHADRGAGCRRESALIREAKANTDVGAKRIADVSHLA